MSMFDILMGRTSPEPKPNSKSSIPLNEQLGKMDQRGSVEPPIRGLMGALRNFGKSPANPTSNTVPTRENPAPKSEINWAQKRFTMGGITKNELGERMRKETGKLALNDSGKKQFLENYRDELLKKNQNGFYERNLREEVKAMKQKKMFGGPQGFKEQKETALKQELLKNTFGLTDKDFK